VTVRLLSPAPFHDFRLLLIFTAAAALGSLAFEYAYGQLLPLATGIPVAIILLFVMNYYFGLWRPSVAVPVRVTAIVVSGVMPFLAVFAVLRAFCGAGSDCL
jgi:hypothetical protein